MSAWLSASYSPKPPRPFSIPSNNLQHCTGHQLIGTQKGTSGTAFVTQSVQTAGKCAHVASSICILACMVKLILHLFSQTCTKLILICQPYFKLCNLIILNHHCLCSQSNVYHWSRLSLPDVCWWCIVRVVIVTRKNEALYTVYTISSIHTNIK